MVSKFEPKRLTDFIDVESFNAGQIRLTKFLIQCPYCGGGDVTFKGWRKNKRKGNVRRYYCKKCKRKFSHTFRGHLPSSIVADVLASLVKGLSPNDIADIIAGKHGSFHISPQTVMNVLKKYVDIFLKFELRRSPHKLESQEWQIDDTPQIFPKVENMEGKRFRFIWITNILAVDTRYWLSAIVSNDRTAEESYKAVKTAMRRAGYAPFKLKCDAYNGHISGAKKAYHFIACDSRSKKEDFGYINLIESLHSFIRRRGVKKRGRFRSIENLQAFIELLRIYYNFLHPNSALGTTPASKAGIAPRFSSWGEFIHYVYWHLK